MSPSELPAPFETGGAGSSDLATHPAHLAHFDSFSLIKPPTRQLIRKMS